MVLKPGYRSKRIGPHQWKIERCMVEAIPLKPPKEVKDFIQQILSETSK